MTRHRDNLTREERAQALLRVISGNMSLAMEWAGNAFLSGFTEGFQNGRIGALADEFALVTGMSAEEAQSRLRTLSIGGREVPIIVNAVQEPTEIRIHPVRVVNLRIGDEDPATATEMARAGEQVARELEEDAMGLVRDENGVLSWAVQEPGECPSCTAATAADAYFLPDCPVNVQIGEPCMSEPESGFFLRAIERARHILDLLRNRPEGWQEQAETQIAQHLEEQIRNVPQAPAQFRDIAGGTLSSEDRREAINIVNGGEYIQEQVSQGPPPGVLDLSHATQEEIDQARESWATFVRTMAENRMTTPLGDFVRVERPMHRDIRVICAGTYDEYRQYCREHGLSIHGQGAPLYAGPTQGAREALRGISPDEVIVIGTYEEALRRHEWVEHEMGDHTARHMSDPSRPGEFVTIDDPFQVPLHIAMDPATDWNPSAYFSSPTQTRWDRMKETARLELVTECGMENDAFEDFWSRACARHECNKQILWNLESYLYSEIAVKKAELEQKDPIQAFLCPLVGGTAMQRLSIAYMNVTNSDNYRQAREMARAHANMLRWT